MWPFTRSAAKKPETRDSGFLRFEDVFPSTPNSYAGANVTADSALTFPAVYRCVKLNAETIASMPVDCLVKRGEKREPYPYPPPWLSSPSPEYDWGQFVQEVQTSLEMDGNSFILKVSSDSGRVVELLHLAPRMVDVRRLGGTDRALPPLIYEVKTGGGVQTFPSNAMLHIKAFTMPRNLRGISPLTYALLQTIGTGLAAQEFGANFFGTGAHLSGLIESPGALTTEATERLKADFAKKHGGVSKSHAIGVLTGGATWKQMSVNPEESQFLETQKWTDDQISQAYGYPPGFFSTDGAKGYVTALHASLRMWNVIGLNSRIVRLERAFSSLLPNQAYIRFNRNSLLRMDPEQRIAYYQAAQLGQWMTVNEIRTLEDLNPMPGGDEPLHSVQWQENEPQPEPQPEPAAEEVTE